MIGFLRALSLLAPLAILACRDYLTPNADNADRHGFSSPEDAKSAPNVTDKRYNICCLNEKTCDDRPDEFKKCSEEDKMRAAIDFTGSFTFLRICGGTFNGFLSELEERCVMDELPEQTRSDLSSTQLLLSFKRALLLAATRDIAAPRNDAACFCNSE